MAAGRIVEGGLHGTVASRLELFEPIPLSIGVSHSQHTNISGFVQLIQHIEFLFLFDDHD